MNVFDAVKQRYSVRQYQDKPIPESDLQKILEAARLAPSARNLQEWGFVVVKDKDAKNKLCEAAKGRQFVAQANIIIACCCLITCTTTNTNIIITCRFFKRRKP